METKEQIRKEKREAVLNNDSILSSLIMNPGYTPSLKIKEKKPEKTSPEGSVQYAVEKGAFDYPSKREATFQKEIANMAIKTKPKEKAIDFRVLKDDTLSLRVKELASKSSNTGDDSQSPVLEDKTKTDSKFPKKEMMILGGVLVVVIIGLAIYSRSKSKK